MKYCELLEEKDWKLWNKHIAIFYPLSFLTSISLFQLCPILLCILSTSGVTFGRNNTSLLHALYWCTRKLKRQLTCNFVGRQRHKKKIRLAEATGRKGRKLGKKTKKHYSHGLNFFWHCYSSFLSETLIPELTVVSFIRWFLSQSRAPARSRLMPTRPSLPRRFISWSGLTTSCWQRQEAQETPINKQILIETVTLKIKTAKNKQGQQNFIMTLKRELCGMNYWISIRRKDKDRMSSTKAKNLRVNENSTKNCEVAHND